MKTKKFLEAMQSMAIIAIVAVIGFTMAACDNGDDETNPFVGTWTYSTIKMVITDSTWTYFNDNIQNANGSYTYSGNTIDFGNGWTGTVSGNTLTVLDHGDPFVTLTKQ
jgi:hypothetical protein